MLRLNVLALFPEFALAFACDFIRSSHVLGGLGSQRDGALPAKPPRGKFWERSSQDQGMFNWLHRRESFKQARPISLISREPEGEENV
ncbi:hypothetical protein RUA4292_03192 [Ruegeria atlantica]|uniref:Uncharacterized protein n=1 Tax=Ruegeria atlantica TaxID=81569 RepID=A0A0P1EFS3_9RHOB|nr:hypothetical protein RUA4292_03192 [Ruegeria atlantica]